MKYTRFNRFSINKRIFAFALPACDVSFYKRNALLMLMMIVLVQSCKPKQNMVYFSNDNFQNEVSQARYEGLHIQEGDILTINVTAFDAIAVKPFNKSSMNQTSASDGRASGNSDNSYVVSPDGTIEFPVLGNVYCKGMTKQQLKNDLENRLKRYLTDPMVSITLQNFNIYVLGDVKGPGQKSSPNERLNIFQAIAIAGDLNDSANRTNVKLIRYSEETGKDQVVSLDLSEASIVNSPYYYLQQNDILYVEPDKNKQISANTTNPNRQLIITLGSSILGIVGLIIGLTR